MRRVLVFSQAKILELLEMQELLQQITMIFLKF